MSAWKDPVGVATTASGTLATSFTAGQVVDGVTLATSDRILIKNQSYLAIPDYENGIYTVNSSGAPTRASDAATGTDLLGAATYVESGTLNAGSVWICTAVPPITVGTTNISFQHITVRPLVLTVAASTSYPYLFPGYAVADLQCTGTNDEVAINAAIYLASALGGGVVELGPGTYSLGGTIALKTHVMLRGQGWGATTLNYQPSSGTALAIQGTDTTHRVQRGGVERLTLNGQGHVATGIAIEFGDTLALRDLELTGWYVSALSGVDWRDSVVDHCRFDWSGSTDGSGVAAVEIQSGADSDADSLEFTNCTWETCRDLDLAIRRGPGTNPNKIRFVSCKFETSFEVRGYERVLVDSAGSFIYFVGCDWDVGGSFDSGWTTPLDMLHIKNTWDIAIRDCFFASEDSNDDPLVNSMVFFDGGPSGGGATRNHGILIDGVTFALDGTTAPVTYPLNWGAVPSNNQVVHNGAHTIVTNNTGTTFTTDQTTPPTSSW